MTDDIDLAAVLDEHPDGADRARGDSAFATLGFGPTIKAIELEIQDLYLSDASPWIVGYSGGKDSTAVLQLVWNSIQRLPESQRTKTVHVISTDTLVENPIVAKWVERSLDVMAKAAAAQNMPFDVHRLTPTLANSFWVNLIGRGYPAPRNKFRWCTERLKIRPSNDFINGVVSSSGEAILVLGTRKAESTRRAANMRKHEAGRVRARLSPNAGLPGSLVYTPVEDWTNDDVWFFLMQERNPWGHNNRDLLGMYSGASADGECPLVVDNTTPSCGDSRFGCWVCTLVEQDKSMSAMIQNDVEKEWMLPLLQLRNALDFRASDSGQATDTDRNLRDFRRMSGAVHLMADGRAIPGPYTQTARANWLTQLLQAQTYIRAHGPDDVRELELVTLDELREIRRIWVMEKHEIEDLLPKIYRHATGQEFPASEFDDSTPFGSSELEVLTQLCGDQVLHYELVRELLSVTVQDRSSNRRAGVFDKIERAIKRGFYDSERDALEHARASRTRSVAGDVVSISLVDHVFEREEP